MSRYYDQAFDAHDQQMSELHPSVTAVISKERVHFKAIVGGKSRSVIINRSDAPTLWLRVVNALELEKRNADTVYYSLKDYVTGKAKQVYNVVRSQTSNQYYYIISRVHTSLDESLLRMK